MMTAPELRTLLDLAFLSGYKSLDSLLVLAEIARNAAPHRALELGAFYGCSTIAIAHALPEDSTLTTVDDFRQIEKDGRPHASKERLRNNLRFFRITERVSIVKADTRKCGEVLDGEFDFVFFDASHTEEELLQEFNSVAPHLTSHATLVIDDTCVVPKTLALMIRDCAVVVHFPELHNGLSVIEWSRP